MKKRLLWCTFGIMSLLVIAGVAYVVNKGLLTQVQGKNQQGKEGEKKEFAAPVFVTTVIRKEVEPMQRFVGTVIPLRTSKVGSAASGRVEQFLKIDDGQSVKEGERVKKGQVIAQLRTGIIGAERDAAAAMVKVRQFELNELKKSWNDEKKRAQARKEIKVALLKYLNFRKDRLRALSQQNSVSDQDYQEVLSLTQQGEAGLEEAEAAINLLQEPWQEKINQVQAKLEAAQAEFNRLDEQFQRYTIRAPFDGYVVTKFTEVGLWVLQGDLMAEIAELDEVHVEVNVLEDYIGLLQIGDKVIVEVNAYPKKTFPGVVDVILPQGSKRSRTFPVKVKLDNPRQLFPGAPVALAGQQQFWSCLCLTHAGHLGMAPDLYPPVGPVQLKAGMMAWVTLPTALKKEALMVPREAVVKGADRQVIFVLKPSDKNPNEMLAFPKQVEMGVAEGDLVEVIGDVQVDEIVVIQGNERLFPGQKVQILKK